MTRLLILAALAAAPAAAGTATFEVFLGGDTLGTLTYADDGGRPASLSTTLDSTPLGVFDGGFTGTSSPVQLPSGEVGLQFVGDTQSSRKSRVVSVLHAGGQVVAVEVQPQDEATDVSATLPSGVLDPVEAFGALVAAGGCPGPLRIFDGRRVVSVTPEGSEPDGDALVCRARYAVEAGPAHLSPLAIQGFDLTMRYAADGSGALALTEVGVRTGPFSVRIAR